MSSLTQNQGQFWILLVLTISKFPLHVQFDQVFAATFEVKDTKKPFLDFYDNWFDWEENYLDLNILHENQLIKHLRPSSDISKNILVDIGRIVFINVGLDKKKSRDIPKPFLKPGKVPFCHQSSYLLLHVILFQC